MPQWDEWTEFICENESPRLDSFIAAKFPDLSRSRAQKLISEGHVLHNGEKTKASAPLTTGDKIAIRLPKPKKIALEAEDIPLHLLYDDDQLAILEKPAGLVVHPGAGHEEGTLVNALLHRFGAELSMGKGIGGELRPGIVHRIDRNTSGILLITKTEKALHHLSEQFQKHTITRRYQGLCWGELPAQGEFSGAIARDPKERKRMAVIESGRRALTKFTRLESWEKSASLFEAELFTGRTHQIRVHFSHAAHPLAGDSIYANANNKAKKNMELGLRQLTKKCPKAAALLQNLQEKGRQFLHAAQLGFVHPSSGKSMEFHSPLPKELEEIVLEWKRCNP
jgi:23S rRNA pseudouridine1911/1915/1917 synthase